MKSVIRSAFVFLFLLVVAASTMGRSIDQSEDQTNARLLWEKAISAKGGRDQLHNVRSLVMSYEETVRNFLGIVVHRGTVERLYVFPDKRWEWDDGLPPPFRLTVRSLDIEHDVRCYFYEGASAPKCKRATDSPEAEESLTQFQYLYLLETKWVKPIPFDVSVERIGLKKVNVVHTRFSDKRINYWLDRKTHLPIRVALFYGTGDKPRLTVDFSEYAPVAGIQMPQRQNRGRISFEINPDYDNQIFRSLSPPAGPKAWRRTKAVTEQGFARSRPHQHLEG